MAEPAITLGFLLFDGFPMACLTSAIEPLRAANEIIGRPEFGWKLVGETAAPIRSSADVRFDPDGPLAQMTGLDSLFLLSAPGARFLDPRGTPARLRWLARHGLTLGAFSGGIFPLVRAGVMQGHRASVHWCYEAAFAAEFPAIATSGTVITRDRRRLTAAGAGAVFDLMLKLIEDRLGAAVMTEVACWFQHPTIRDEAVRQKTPVPHTGSTADMLPAAIRQAIRLFADHIEDPIQIADVACAVALSARHLERSFKQATGQSPLKYYRQMRLKRARQRVLYSTDSLTEIALSIGYASSTPMVRHYCAEFGLKPAQDRRQHTALRISGVTVSPAPLI